jgi:yecA family protein
MNEKVAFDELDAALRRCGSNWDAAQAHGLLTGRLAIGGAPVAPDWLLQVLEDTDEHDANRQECLRKLDSLYKETFWHLTERLSEFTPLLPDDGVGAEQRAVAMGHWCEGFLHGLVSAGHGPTLKKRLAQEPLADIIRDMLQITRAAVDEESDAETNEAAYAEILEYVRVAAQLAYEELSDIRHTEEQ